MPKSNPKRPKKKPRKPRPDFPLFAHVNGQWAKKIKGKLYYFGRWADTDAALKLYLDTREDLYAGRTPRKTRDGLTVANLANHFLDHKKMLVDSGELASRTFRRYYVSCEMLATTFGKKRLVDDLVADDFQAKIVAADDWATAPEVIDAESMAAGITLARWFMHET